MSDRYLINEICKWCKEDFSEEQPLFMGDEDDPIIVKCPKCGKKTKFWVDVKVKSKKEVS